jgi:sulfur carrier protein
MIVLNGEPSDLSPGQTVARMLLRLDLARDARGVAVAVNGEIVPRSTWDAFALPAGARVEVLTAMQGG